MSSQITQNFKKVYFIGIGGIGMSALARYFKSKGITVVGSDRDLKSESVKSLIAEGIEVIDQKEIDNYNVLKNIYDADCVIYTLAIPADSLELKTAESQDLPIFTYAEMLGQVSENNFTIAVAGTHGKTTTTAMTAEIAKNLKLEPNVIVGSFLSEEKSNFVSGNSDLFIVEACEYGRSFLNLYPNILIITNLEEDHLDYYRDLGDIQQAFYDLAAKLPEDGKIVCQTNDPNLEKIVLGFPDKIVDYLGLVPNVPEMSVFGEHNKQNAAAAICAIQQYVYLQKSDIEIESDKVIESLKSFKGTWRRMEFKGQVSNSVSSDNSESDGDVKGTTVYDDYGHHPTEIEATLKSFKENFPDKKIAVVFQPHLHSRTKMFFEEFVSVLSRADKAIIYPIYKARDEDDFGVSAELLVEKINEKTTDEKNPELARAEFCDSFEKIAEEINKLSDEWIVILLGAGEVYQISDLLNLNK